MNSSTHFIDRLTELYKEKYHTDPKEVILLPVAGSERRYLRFISEDNQSIIGTYNPNKAENNTFFYFSSLFERNELPVPKILHISQEKELYLQEDLGSQSLYDIIESEGHSDRVKTLLKKSIDQLVRFHWQAGQVVDYSMCFASEEFNKQQILADLLYFKYYFADLLSVKYNGPDLLEDLSAWSDELAGKQPKTFMYRDFQSRNIIITENDEVTFIDYQGGMRGLPEYDLASLLWQSRAQFPDDWKTELLNYYFEALKNSPVKAPVNEEEFRRTYINCILLRMLQTLGAYGFRGIIQQKGLFIKSIAPALKQLEGFLNQYSHVLRYNELENLLNALIKPEIQNQFNKKDFPIENKEKLKVSIYSFSYKKGIPADSTEHGGGYVFDCRGILNPGRKEKYKSLTGKDKSVKDYLEQKTQMPDFAQNVFNLVDISIKDYLERGFDHLMISFGCTGGQHRSVYAAEALAEHLRINFDLDPTILHLEQEPNSVPRVSKA